MLPATHTLFNSYRLSNASNAATSAIVIIDNNFCYFLCQPSSDCGASQVLAAFAVVSLKIEKCFSVVAFFSFQLLQTSKLPFYLLLAAALAVIPNCSRTLVVVVPALAMLCCAAFGLVRRASL